MQFHIIRLKSYPIYEQLLLEERLLRGGEGNWCLINEGSSPAIVMGISGKKEELIDCERAKQADIPLIKRFSGGGTVIVDENTFFVTFICDKKLHSFPAYPEPILRWAETFYKDVFLHPEFCLRENDFVIGEKKFGGNAQYIQKQRWLHHTSFLWDYTPEKMSYLLHPKKTPVYRNHRTHEDFLCRLKDHFSDRENIIQQILHTLRQQYGAEEISLVKAESLSPHSGRQSTVRVS